MCFILKIASKQNETGAISSRVTFCEKLAGSLPVKRPGIILVRSERLHHDVVQLKLDSDLHQPLKARTKCAITTQQ